MAYNETSEIRLVFLKGAEFFFSKLKRVVGKGVRVIDNERKPLCQAALYVLKKQIPQKPIKAKGVAYDLL